MLTPMTEIAPNQIESQETRKMVEDALSTVVTAAKAYQIVVDEKGNGMSRQGDVLLRRVPNNTIKSILRKDDPKAKARDGQGRIVLVRGENGGNTHAVVGKEVQYFETDGQRNVIGYLECAGEAVLRHEEHGPQIIPPGIYEIRRQTQGAQWEERVAD